MKTKTEKAKEFPEFLEEGVPPQKSFEGKVLLPRIQKLRNAAKTTKGGTLPIALHKTLQQALRNLCYI